MTGQSVDRFVATSLRLWLAVTAVVGVAVALAWALGGAEAVAALVRRGPLSSTPLTLVSVGIVWSAWGAALASVRTAGSRSRYGLPVVLSTLILCLYVNLLRERPAYGDVEEYVRAAFALHEGGAIPARYLYPPLLITLCQPLVPFGASAVAGALWLANVVSLVLFYWLLRAALVRYALGPTVASLAVFVFMLINVPILRTLGYVQVNLHVTNLVLAALLCYPRRPILSAVALAAAAHLKVSPLALALPFVWERDRKWTASFVVALVALASPTLVLYGTSPFAEFVNNIGHIYAAVGLAFRDSSVDSLVRGLGGLTGKDLWPLLMLVKGAVLGLTLLTAASNVRHGTFRPSGPGDRIVHNAMPAMLLFMTLAAPVVWEHHAVFVSLPFLAVASRLDSPRAWTAYAFAYLLEFVLPTFDVYPLSYGRLVAPVVLACLMLGSVRPADGRVLVRGREGLDDLLECIGAPGRTPRASGAPR